MKETIKTIIALAVILVSYFIGSYFANETCNAKVNDLNEQLKNKEHYSKELKDSLTLIRKQLIECTSKNGDTLKIQFISIPKKGNKK